MRGRQRTPATVLLLPKHLLARALRGSVFPARHSFTPGAWGECSFVYPEARVATSHSFFPLTLLLVTLTGKEEEGKYPYGNYVHR